ncbi:MAG: hypothetical protein ACR2F8_00915 [Caulobacteraceae bacterium]
MTGVLKIFLAAAVAVTTIALTAPAWALTHRRHHHHLHHVVVAVHHRRVLHRHGREVVIHRRPYRRHAHIAVIHPAAPARRPMYRHAALCQQVLIHGRWVQHCR